MQPDPDPDADADSFSRLVSDQRWRCARQRELGDNDSDNLCFRLLFFFGNIKKMIEKVSWEEVKKFFEKEAIKLGKTYLTKT